MLIVFIVVGVAYVNPANWTPFIPPNTGKFGAVRLERRPARRRPSIFFAYIGFDAVSTAAQEAKNPQRDMPIGILGSLVICTVLYIVVSRRADRHRATTSELNVPHPVAVGIDAIGLRWLAADHQARRDPRASLGRCS